MLKGGELSDNIAGNRRIAKNTLFLYARMFFVLAVSLYTSRVVLNVLGVADFGTYNVVCGFVSMFTFLNAAMSNAVQRFYNYEIGKNNGLFIAKVYTSAVFTQFMLMLIVVVLVAIVGIWYLNNKMVIPTDRLYAARYIFGFSVVSFALLIMQVPYNAALMAYEKMNYYALISVVDVLLKLVIVIILPSVDGDRLIFYGFGIMMVQSMSFLMSYCYVRKNFKLLKIEKKVDGNYIKQMLIFSGWNMFGSFAYTIKGQGINVLLNAFFGTIVNAARGISYQVLSAIQGFAQNIFVAFRPQLVQSYAIGDYKRTETLMFSMSKVTFYLFYMLALPIMLEIDYVLHLWLGDIVPQYTSIFTILIILNALISNFNTPLSQVIHATGKMRTYQIVTSLITCSILPLSWIYLRLDENPVGVYWISLFVSIVNQMVCLCVVKKYFPFSLKKYAQKVVYPCLLIFIIAALIPMVLHNVMEQSFVRLVVVGCVSVVSIVLISYYLGMSVSERIFIRQYIKIFTNKTRKA